MNLNPLSSPSGQPLNHARRPLPALALAFIAGTAFGLWREPPIIPVLLATGCCLLAIMVGDRQRRTWTTAFVFVGVALAGSGAVMMRTAWPSPRMQAVAALDRQASLELIVQVIGDPTRYTTHSNRSAWEVPAKILAWRDAETRNWHHGDGTLSVRWRAIDFQPEPRYGDRWKIHGAFYSMDGPSPAGMRERFWASRTERHMTDTGHAWLAHCFAWRRAAAKRLAAGIERFPEHIAVVQALLLGLRQELTPTLRQRFSATGTLHVMAISGLHVGVMTGLFIFILQTLGLSRTTWFYFLAPLLIAYTLATGARPSAVRACIMALAYWSALPLRRRPDAPSALALAALLILGYDPFQLTSPGFLFSFIVVAGLLVFFKLLHARLMRPLRARTLYAPSLPGPGAIRRERDRLVSGTLGLITVSMIAWIMAAPLSAHYFGRISLIALPANLLVVPLALLIVLTGCLALVSGAMLPLLGEVFNHTNLVWTEILLRVLGWFADLPGAALTLAIPSWTIPVWYGLLILLGWRLHRHRDHRR